MKADAYGHGLSRIFPALEGADILAVATTGEAAICRQQGWRDRLLLLEGPSNAAEFDAVVALDAEMVVHHETQLELLRQRRSEVRRALWLKPVFLGATAENGCIFTQKRMSYFFLFSFLISSQQNHGFMHV